MYRAEIHRNNKDFKVLGTSGDENLFKNCFETREGYKCISIFAGHDQNHIRESVKMYVENLKKIVHGARFEYIHY